MTQAHFEACAILHTYYDLFERYDSLNRAERIAEFDALHVRALLWLETCSWSYEI